MKRKSIFYTSPKTGKNNRVTTKSQLFPQLLITSHFNDYDTSGSELLVLAHCTRTGNSLSQIKAVHKQGIRATL